MTPTRPALRYHGGKWRLAPWILENLPAHRVYVEPFGGGASVLLRKERSRAEVYNDLDGEIVAFFRVLQDPTLSLELERQLVATPFARDEFTLAYERTEDPVERARRLVIRSFMGFGSDGCNDARPTGFRANSNQSTRTPALDWVNYAPQIGAFCARLRGVVLENRPAVEVIKQQDGPETVFYVDPPYLHETRSAINNSAGKNYRHEMTDEDHRELAEVLNAVEGKVVLSGYASDLYEELFGNWVREEREALADGARKRTEILWFNQAARDQHSLALAS